MRPARAWCGGEHLFTTVIRWGAGFNHGKARGEQRAVQCDSAATREDELQYYWCLPRSSTS